MLKYFKFRAETVSVTSLSKKGNSKPISGAGKLSKGQTKMYLLTTLQTDFINTKYKQNDWSFCYTHRTKKIRKYSITDKKQLTTAKFKILSI
jgi:hypothetical protein